MKKLLLLGCTLFWYSILFAQIPSGYYNTTKGKEGFELKTELYNIIKGHTSRSYNSLWNYFRSTDVKDNGQVWDMYSDNPGGNPPYIFRFGNDQCGTYGGEGDCYNREHSFPKSWFDKRAPMVTDLFHLYPTDGKVNGQRSNYPFGNVQSANWTSRNGSKRGACSHPDFHGIVFEPIDEYKGDFARTYFYMATRYENIVKYWEHNSSNSNAVLNGTSTQVFEDWLVETLLEWHRQDPVSQKELDRNDEVYKIQHNRNPFIDHPEFVEEIWGDPTAIPEDKKVESIKVFYNSSKDEITIKNTDASIPTYSVTIYNALGQTVKQTKTSQSEIFINTSNFSNGIYIVYIKAPFVDYRQKVMIVSH